MPPNFHTLYDWSTGTTWIADGYQKVARIEPPRLRDLKFEPDGEPIGTWLTLFWWQYVDHEQENRSAWITDELSLNDHDPERYRLTLRSHNADRSIESRCELVLTYDSEKTSYLYDVHMNLQVLPDQEWLVIPSGGVEYANPWFIDAVGSSVDYPGSTPPRWTWVIYSSPSGKIHRLPLNHLGAPPMEQVRFSPGRGWLGFFDHPEGNPIIEFDGDTAQNTQAEVCAWGYDTHFIYRINPVHTQGEPASNACEPIVLKSGQELTVNYRLYCLSSEQSQALIQQAEQVPLEDDLSQSLVRPAYIHPVNTFQKAVSPDRPDRSWYWSASHPEGVTWDRANGRSDNASLSIQNSETRTAYWQVPIGPDFWMQPLSLHQQKLGCWIRTERVEGKGAFLSFRYSNYEIEMGQQPPFGEISSKPISGSQEWTYMEIEIGPPPAGATRAYICLKLDGTGKAWFDDVTFLPAT